MVAIHANVEVSLREDALQLDHVLTIFNRGRNAWLPKGIDIPLPPGWKAFAPEDLGELVTIAREGDSLRLAGTVAPGRHHVAFRYQVPMGDRDAETVRVRLPPRVGAARVAAEAGGRIALEVKSFPTAEREPTRSGKKQLVTERQVLRQEAMSGGISELEVTLRGLPVRPSGPWISAALAALVAVFGLALALGRKKAERQSEEREDLEEARDALLGEIAELERLRAAGEVGPKSFAELEAALLDALARVLERLEAIAPKKKRRKKAGAQGATA
jgi:hypothetical protein